MIYMWEQECKIYIDCLGSSHAVKTRDIWFCIVFSTLNLQDLLSLSLFIISHPQSSRCVDPIHFLLHVFVRLNMHNKSLTYLLSIMWFPARLLQILLSHSFVQNRSNFGTLAHIKPYTYAWLCSLVSVNLQKASAVFSAESVLNRSNYSSKIAVLSFGFSQWTSSCFTIKRVDRILDSQNTKAESAIQVPGILIFSKDLLDDNSILIHLNAAKNSSHIIFFFHCLMSQLMFGMHFQYFW